MKSLEGICCFESSITAAPPLIGKFCLNTTFKLLICRLYSIWFCLKTFEFCCIFSFVGTVSFSQHKWSRETICLFDIYPFRQMGVCVCCVLIKSLHCFLATSCRFWILFYIFFFCLSFICYWLLLHD